jgi:hypothetical protein
MRMPILLGLIASLSVATVVDMAAGYPRPARVSSRPEVDFTPTAARMFTAANGDLYWYLVYDVVNMTGQDRTWAPSMTLYTDRGEVRRDGDGVPQGVHRAIMEHVGDPLLEPKVAIIGTLRQGVGNARRGMAVWPAGSQGVNELRIFIEGISSETATVKNPVTGDPVTLRKNLYLHYLIPGDASTRGDRPIAIHPGYAGEEHWVLR